MVRSYLRYLFILLLAFISINSLAQSFITTWKTDNPGTSNDNQITIPTTGGGYDYNVLWFEVGNPTNTGTLLNITGDVTIDFPVPSTYQVEITGQFPQIYFNAGLSFLPQKDREKILSVDQWGDIAWTSMSNAFAGCENLRINAIDAPDLSGVTTLFRMFFNATVMNDDINHWDVSTITSMSGLFREAEAFNQPLNTWDVSNVTNMSELFFSAPAFNQDMNTWVVDNVTNMQSMFLSATAFNGNVSSWHVDNVTNMSSMFGGAASFNQDISGWQITSATNLAGIFSGATAFNQDISTKIGGGNNGGDAWDTNGVTNMAGLFRNADAFTQPIVNWDVSTVTNMSDMFANHNTFNQDISGWVVDNVTDMRSMFAFSTLFNQDISGWIVSAVRDFNGMFANATSFNQPIGSWTLNTISNIDMRNMFDGASSFDQDLSSWNITRLTLAVNMFNNSGLSVANYDLLLEGWAAQPVNSGVSFGAEGIYFCSAQAARDILTNAPNNWFITDGGNKCISLFDGPDTTAPEILNGQPQAIDYGSTSTNKTRSFTILNKLSIPITVDIVNPGVGFPTTLNFPTIPAGGTQTFSVNLTGPVGTYTETVGITSPNFSGSFQYDVTGEVTATAQPEIKVFQGNTVFGTPILDGQIPPLDFLFEIIPNSGMRQFTITNIGDADLDISDITVSGTVFTLGSTPPTLIPINGTAVVQVIMSGANAGIFLETVDILSNDTDEAIFNFNLSGEIIGPDIWVVDGLDIFLDPEILNGQITPIDFGSGPSGSDIVRQLIITNAALLAELAISNISISGTAFTFTPSAPFTVFGEWDGVYDEITFEITLSGATPGTFNETVTITSDDETDPIFTFPITGVIIAVGCGAPPSAIAGADQTICEGSLVSLSGSISNAITPTWSTAGDGTFDNINSLTAVYTPGSNDISLGSVMLTLTTEDPDGAGSCVAASASMTITINQAATVSAGVNISLCEGNVANLNATIGGSASSVLWTGGAGNFDDPTSLTPVYTPDASETGIGPIVLTVTTNDPVGICPAAVSFINLTVSPLATANAGANISICEGSTASLNGTIGGAATTSIWSTSGDGIFDNTNILTSVYTPGTTDIITGNVTLTLTTNDPDGAGPCVAATSQIIVTIDGAPTVDAGTDAAICATDVAMLSGTMNANASNSMWSTSGSGTFSTANLLNSIYTPSAADISAGSITLTLTVDGSGVCPQVSDQLVISIASPIVAGTPSIQLSIGQAFNVDVLAVSTINSGDIIVISILQNPTKGTVTIQSNNTIDYTAATGTIGTDSFEYQICNQCGLCDVAIVSVDILNAAPEFTAPSTSPEVAPGQSIVISVLSLIADLNNNLDLNSFSNFNSTANASFTYDPNTGDLTLDYTNAIFSSAQDNITFTICDQLGACTDVALQVDLNGEITVFNGVSPNWDGLNDFFKIENIQFIEPINKVTIYNRWGDRVYEMDNYNSQDPDKRFEGNQNNGKELPSGVYFYKVEFTSVREGLSGYLSLKR